MTLPNLENIFGQTRAREHWRRFGWKRRAGVSVPLFSLYSQKSLGVGEIPDLKLLVDWCLKTHMSIIQLLPLNDVGFDFQPYSAQSSLALDPLYLRLDEIPQAKEAAIQEELANIHVAFPAGDGLVDYGIKQAKLTVLRRLFDLGGENVDAGFQAFRQAHRSWLRPYSLFRVIKEAQGQASWQDWPQGLREGRADALAPFEKEQEREILFHQWLQWQLHEQLREIKDYAQERGVYLMGDLPFLVSGDSADVWAHQHLFKLDFSSGAPPDMYSAKGQRWGMPPYNWGAIEGEDHAYWREKLQYAQNFFHFYRVDHIIGIFRLWNVANSDPEEQGGLQGFYEPAAEHEWEEQGRRLLGKMLEMTEMLPCGEDLGTVPDCSYRVLADMGVPGMDVQRWKRQWGDSYDFLGPEDYRINSVAVISSHDTTPLRAWWESEAGTVDEDLFLRKCAEKNLDEKVLRGLLFTGSSRGTGRLRWKKEISDVGALLHRLQRSEQEVWELVDMYKSSFDEAQRYLRFLGLAGGKKAPSHRVFVRRALERAHEAASVFSIQLLQDWLALGGMGESNLLEARINRPGTTDERNWRLVMPLSLEELLQWKKNREIKELNDNAGRV